MFLSGSATAAGIAAINSFGNFFGNFFGGFAGPEMIGWVKDWTGSCLGGLWFVAALLVLSPVLTAALARSAGRAPAAIAEPAE